MDQGTPLSLRRSRKTAGRLCAGLCAAALACITNEARAQNFFYELFGGGRGAPWRPPPWVERRPAAPRVPRAIKRPLPQQPGKPQAGATATPAIEPPPPPYEPQLLRLSEILGALAYLRDLCGAKDGEDWRAAMFSLLDAEAKAGQRRQKLTGAFNRGFHGYELTYHACTPNAELAISRYLEESQRLARDISYRFGNS